MRDFRRKDKKKNEGIFLPMPSFFSEKVRSGDRTAHQPPQKRISCYMTKPLPRPAPSHKQKAHQTMGFLLVKLSIPGGNAVVTSSGGCPIEASLIPITREMPSPVSRRPSLPSWKRWLFLRVSADVLRTSALCRRSFHGSSHSFR